MSEFGTIVVYSGSILFLGSIINTSSFTWEFLLKVLAITAIAWLPFEILGFLYHKAYPTDLDKIREEAKARSKIKNTEKKGSILLTDLESKNDRNFDDL